MLTREGLTPDIAFGVISSEIGTNRSWWSLETVSGRSHSGQSFIIVFRRIDVYFEGMPRQVRIELKRKGSVIYYCIQKNRRVFRRNAKAGED